MAFRRISRELKRFALQLLQRRLISVRQLLRLRVFSRATLYRLRIQEEQPPPLRGVPGRPRILDEAALAFLQELLLARPDFYLDELVDIVAIAEGVRVSRSTMHRYLERLGITLKRAHRIAKERDDDKRRAYDLRIGRYEAQQLIFADEMAYDARDGVRIRARSRRNHLAPLRRPYIRGHRLSCIAGLSMSGMLAPWAVKGSFNEQRFHTYLRLELLPSMLPYPQPRSVLVLDNASIHKSARIRELVESFGA
ncbi:hypothetical protein CF326_g3865 [Tilletia indica]|nr:hypothetical protein CF326_g3865 [Tilletia indica]